MSLQLSNRRIVLWASEPDPKTPSDAVEALLTDGTKDLVYQQVRNPVVTPDGETVSISRARGSASGVRHGFIQGLCNVSMEVPLLAWPASGEPPHYAPVLKAMNLKEIISGGSVTYRPATAQQAAMTVYLFTRNAEDDNWRLQIATGVRGNGTIQYAVNGEPYIAFEGTGQYAELSASAEYFDPDTGAIALLKDGTTPVTARTTGAETYADQDPMLCKGMEVKGGGVDWLVSGIELDLGWTVANVDAVTGASTRQKGLVTRGDDARVNGSFDLVDMSDAVLDGIIAAYQAGTEMTLTIGISNAEGKVALAAPKMQLGLYSESANNNLLSYTIPYYFNGDWSSLAADNDFTLSYTAP